MIIFESNILDESGRRVTAKEFWDWSKKNNNVLGLTFLGFARPIIKIQQENDLPRFELILVTDIGQIKYDLKYTEKDYIVYKKYWIPFEMNYFEPVYYALRELSVMPGTQLSIGKLLKLVSILRNYQIEIINEARIEKLVVRPTVSEHIELALPLYEYQEKGTAWMIELSNQEIGGLLCDEMGLGKTAQAFGLIKYFVHKSQRKILIITPASLIYNWAREFEKFLPGMHYNLHFGPNRSFHPNELEKMGILIVSYDLLSRDFSNFNKVTWDLVICDEAQALKNANSKRHNAVSDLKCLCKFLITGTPIENSLSDLWSLINIVRPGLLGNLRSFQALIEDFPSDAKKLSNFASPLILRRLVRDVAQELPQLVTKVVTLNGTEQFKTYYEERRLEMMNSKLNQLAAITELSQICCYPGIKDPEYRDSQDAKLNETLEILLNVKNKEEKAIIFSTFTASLDLLRNVISRQLSPDFISIIDGRVSVNQRQSLISSFQNLKGFAVLCIQPAAGGVGLNITGANHVIHFNRQWNPAVERQATARAHRRGQNLIVFEYLLSYMGTIEEYISDTLARKTELASIGTETPALEGSNKDIQKALSISPMYNHMYLKGKNYNE
jgi:SNF2 family DNA or RNA helicase